MAENAQDSPGPTIREQINDMQKDVKRLTQDMAEIKSDYRHQSKNSEKIDVIERELNQAKGAVKLVQWGGLFIIGGMITYMWGLSAGQIAISQRISDSNQRIAVVEEKLIRLDTDISALSKRPLMEHK